jgi:hypothetical protein
MKRKLVIPRKSGRLSGLAGSMVEYVMTDWLINSKSRCDKVDKKELSANTGLRKRLVY